MKAAGASNSGAISSASSGHFVELKKKNILALFMKESVISLIVDYMWLILTF